VIQCNFRKMLTTGEIAKILGVDRRTITVWAKRGIIPSFVNPANGYRHFDKREVINALGLNKRTKGLLT
jgi:excisionase family DNA binding protein